MSRTFREMTAAQLVDQQRTLTVARMSVEDNLDRIIDRGGVGGWHAENLRAHVAGIDARQKRIAAELMNRAVREAVTA